MSDLKKIIEDKIKTYLAASSRAVEFPSQRDIFINKGERFRDYKLNNDHFKVEADISLCKITLEPSEEGDKSDKQHAGHVIGIFLSDVRTANDKRTWVDKVADLDETVKRFVQKIKGTARPKVNSTIMIVLPDANLLKPSNEPRHLKAKTLEDLIEGINRTIPDKLLQIDTSLLKSVSK